jgi:N-acetylglucosamine malate deacetylase 1
LRLYRETGFRIINVPITFGSDLARRDGRRKELENACQYLGFEIEIPVPEGFENIKPEAREHDSENWNFAVNRIVELISELKPQVIFFPHRYDRHPTHCGTNLLVLDALNKMPEGFSCITVENEFWQAMEIPNCLVELSDEIVSDLICALSLHVGEVERNPYHVTFPSWLIDSVRRGSEIVGKAGSNSQDFTFGVLHKISLFKGGELSPMFENGEFISMKSDLLTCLESSL